MNHVSQQVPPVERPNTRVRITPALISVVNAVFTIGIGLKRPGRIRSVGVAALVSALLVTTTGQSPVLAAGIAPTVTGLSPSSGPTTGGTTVTVNGTGFT